MLFTVRVSRSALSGRICFAVQRQQLLIRRREVSTSDVLLPKLTVVHLSPVLIPTIGEHVMNLDAALHSAIAPLGGAMHLEQV